MQVQQLIIAKLRVLIKAIINTTILNCEMVIIILSIPNVFQYKYTINISTYDNFRLYLLLIYKLCARKNWTNNIRGKIYYTTTSLD